MDIWYIVTVIAVVFVSMTTHEIMHGYVARLLGDTTAADLGRLSFNPLKHIDPFLTLILPVALAIFGLPIFGGAKPVPFNPNRVKGGEWGVALVAAAGPLTNFLLAFISFAIVTLSGVASGSVIGQILIVSTMVNLGFFVFNIIPIPPLDGSRVLFAFAPDFVRKIMTMIEQAGLVFVFVAVLVASSYIGQFIYFMVSYILQAFSWVLGLK